MGCEYFPAQFLDARRWNLVFQTRADAISGEQIARRVTTDDWILTVSPRRGPQRRDRLASNFDLRFLTIRYLNHWANELNIEQELMAKVALLEKLTVLWICGA